MRKTDKICVTGGTGFIGSYILRELIHQGYRNIHALRREDSDIRLIEPFKEAISWHVADLSDIDKIYQFIKGSKGVIHSAGLVSFAPGDQEKLYEVNVHGTATIVNACLEHKVQRLIHLSSIAALAKTRNGELITENTKWVDNRNTSHYGRTKHLGEMEVWRGMAEGLDSSILNPSIVLGAGDWNSSSCRLFMQINNGLAYYPPGSTGFVDVRDVARITCHMVHHPTVNQKFILNQSNYSFKYIFSLMARELEVNPPSMKAPQWVAKSIVFLEALKSKFTGAKPVITSDSVRNAYENFHYSNDRIKSLEFSFIPIEQTIHETATLLKEAAIKGFSPVLLPPTSIPEPKTAK